MHVLFVVPRFHPYPGGYETYVLHLARHLLGMGHQVTVVTTTAYDLESFWLRGFRTLPAGREEFGGITVIRLPISTARWSRRAGRLLGLLPHWQLKAKFAPPSFAVRGLTAHLRQFANIDAIHVGPLPYNRLMYEGWLEGRRRGARVLATPCTHFGEDQNRVVAQHYTQAFQIALLNACDCVLALTKCELDRLQHAGVKEQRLFATGAGIDVAEVTGGDADRLRKKYGIDGALVLHLGTKAPDKGSITVVESMRRLWAGGCQAWMALVGSSVTEFDEYLRSHPVTSSRLLNLGVVSAAEKRDLLAAASLLVHPSRVESLGLVYLEAWANRKPVIAADTGVSREVIAAGRDGLLVPFGDAAALADAMRRLLEDPTLRDAMGAAGHHKVQAQFSWPAAANRIYPLFQKNNAEECLMASEKRGT
jgi:glycogen(starch) synthase